MSKLSLDFPDAAASQPQREKFRTAITALVEPYAIQKGDTLDAIARAHDLGNYLDLLAINRFVDPAGAEKYELTGKRARVIIRAGDTILVPKKGSKDRIDTELQSVREYAKIRELNARTTSGAIDLLKEDVEDRIFEKSPTTLSSAAFLGGFIREQERTLDPKLPAIIDERNRRDVACIHMLRRLDYLRANGRDRSVSEKAYVLKPNVDAWEVQAELEKIGYKRLFHELAEATDPALAGKPGIPVSAANRPEYDRLVRQLAEHLEKYGAPGSYMSTSYRFSRYREAGSREHPNTHQMMYLGNSRVEFPAFEFPEVKGGKIMKFSDDLGILRQKLATLEAELPSDRKSVSKSMAELVNAIDPNKNPQLEKRGKTLVDILSRSTAHLPAGEKRDAVVAQLERAFSTKNTDTVAAAFAQVYRRPAEVFHDDALYVVSLQKQKEGIDAGLRMIRDIVERRKTTAAEVISVEQLGLLLVSNPRLKQAVETYNSQVRKLNAAQEEIELSRKNIANYAKNQAAEKLANQQKLAKLEEGMSKIRSSFENAKADLAIAIDADGNPELAKSLGFLKSRLQKAFPNRAEQVERALAIGDDTTLTQLVPSADERAYIKNLAGNRRRALAGIARIRGAIGQESTDSPRIELASMSRALADNPMIREAVAKYNAEVGKLETTLADISQAKDALKHKKTISAVDFFANFVAARSDTHFSLGVEWRRNIMEGIARYPGLIKMEINGKPVDFATEILKLEKDRVKVTPDDRVAISGPMMLDGFHRLEADGTPNPKMDSRTRFLSEAVVSGLMFPTELHEPTADSVYGRETPNPIAKQLVVRGMYGLSPREELGKVLKSRIEKDFERMSFEKLEREFPKRDTDMKQGESFAKKRDALLAKFYAKQIQALQLAGYLESEDRINPLATNANRPIPYFDTSKAGFDKLYANYVSERKLIAKAKSERHAEDRNFISFLVYPGDTYKSMHERIVDRLNAVAKSQPKYASLAAVSGFDSAMDRSFLRACFTSFFEKYGWKYADAYGLNRADMDKSAKIETFMSGRIKSGSEFVLPLDDLLRISKGIQESYAFRDIPVKPVDDGVIRLVSASPRMQGFMKAVLVRESYVPEGSIGKRRFAKDHYGGVQSQTDFQIRFLRDSVHGWKTGKQIEWPKSADYLRAFDLLRGDRFERIRATLVPDAKDRVAQDLSTIAKIRPLIEKSTQTRLTEEEIETIESGLLPMLGMDDGTGSNIVGKLLGAALLEKRLDSLSTKLEGVLQYAGANIDQILSKPEGREKFTDTLLLSNNLGEKDVFLFAITENYMVRLLKGLALIEGRGKTYQAKEIEENMKWGMIPTGQKELGTAVFIEHMKHLTDLMVANGDIIRKNNSIRENGTNEEILSDSEKMSETTHRIAVRRIIMGLGIRIQEIANTGKKGTALDADISRAIFSFFNDPELREHLSAIANEKNLPASVRTIVTDDILPRQEERTGFLWSYLDRKKEKATPGKRENIFEFTGKAIGSSLGI